MNVWLVMREQGSNRMVDSVWDNVALATRVVNHLREHYKDIPDCRFYWVEFEVQS